RDCRAAPVCRLRAGETGLEASGMAQMKSHAPSRRQVCLHLAGRDPDFERGVLRPRLCRNQIAPAPVASADCKRSEVIVDPGAGLVPLMGIVCVDMVSFLNVMRSVDA